MTVSLPFFVHSSSAFFSLSILPAFVFCMCGYLNIHSLYKTSFTKFHFFYKSNASFLRKTTTSVLRKLDTDYEPFYFSISRESLAFIWCQMEPADLIAARSKLQALHIWWVLCRFIYTFGLSSRTHSGWSPWLKVILHGTIRNDDFKLNTALQCSNNVSTIRNNAATMLQRCVALKIVVTNRSCNITLTRADNPISQSVST